MGEDEEPWGRGSRALRTSDVGRGSAGDRRVKEVEDVVCKYVLFRREGGDTDLSLHAEVMEVKTTHSGEPGETGAEGVGGTAVIDEKGRGEAASAKNKRGNGDRSGDRADGELGLSGFRMCRGGRQAAVLFVSGEWYTRGAHELLLFLLVVFVRVGSRFGRRWKLLGERPHTVAANMNLEPPRGKWIVHTFPSSNNNSSSPWKKQDTTSSLFVSNTSADNIMPTQDKRSSDQLRKRKSSARPSVDSIDPSFVDASSANDPLLPTKRSSKPSTAWGGADSSSTSPTRKPSKDPDNEAFEAAIEKNAGLGFVFSTPQQRRRPSYIRDWDGTAAYVGCKKWLKWLVVILLFCQIGVLIGAVIKEAIDAKRKARHDERTNSATEKIEFIVYAYLGWMGLSVGSCCPILPKMSFDILRSSRRTLSVNVFTDDESSP